MTSHHIAQINVAQAKYDVGDPGMAAFEARIDEINNLAESSPGFVWRWIEERDGGKEFLSDQPRLLINISVWEDLPSLHSFVFRSAHTPVMGRKEDWFDAMDKPYFCLWWTESGRRPTVREAFDRLEILHKQGPTEAAFTWSKRFPPA